jgi:hypothetical protein
MPQRFAGDAPAEAVLDVRIIGFRRGSERQPARFVVEQAVVVQRGIPAREIVDR